MRTILDDKLEELNIELIKMGALCEDILKYAVEIFIDGKDNLPKERQLNEEIIHRERVVEQDCMNILLLQQPVARDLRYVSSALRIIYDMERIGNQATDMSEIAHYLSEPIDDPLIKEMAYTTRRMVVDSIEAFVKKDLTLARKTADKDDLIDEYFVKVRDSLIEEIDKDKEHARKQLDVYMITKYLERIGDHAENICKWVIYSITGEKIE